MRHLVPAIGWRAVVAAVATMAGCDGVISGAGPVDPAADAASPTSDDAGASDAATPFEALAPEAYGTKVKNLMTGAPLTDAEYRQLTSDPGALPSLIDAWMAQPAWHDRLLHFFEQAFQQTQLGDADIALATHLLNRRYVRSQAMLVPSLEQSFARTALELIAEHRPFTEVVTTRRYMLNTGMMSLWSFMDATPLNDDGEPMRSGYWLLDRYPSMQTVIESSHPIPFAQTIDPTSPNFMHWYCSNTDLVMTGNSYTGTDAPMYAMRSLLLSPDDGGVMQDHDWSDWRMVTVRTPRSPSETPSVFYDLPSLRGADELVLRAPQVGFMTTPAFQANWPTNSSNQARVTTNQTMIVALGYAFDDTGVTVSVTSSASDAEHATPGTVCYGCHQTLDPMRDLFRESYTYGYALRPGLGMGDIPAMGTFSVLGSEPVHGRGVLDLANAAASHPRFATAWTQKLCEFANSAPCDESDPEFVRVATAFHDSGFDFERLVRELFASPLVTYASPTLSARENQVAAAIARRESWCFSLSNRLGLPDVCGFDASASNPRGVPAIALSVPGAGYARGQVAPSLPTDPDLFFQSATQNICVALATRLVDAPTGTPRWTSANADAALDDFVHLVMGVPASDPRSAPLRAILVEHRDEAIAQHQSPAVALQSAFVLACQSPTSVAVGL